MTTAQLLRLAETYAARRKIALSTIGRIAGGNGGFFKRVKEGRVTIRRAERVCQWFSDHWPADAEWPAAIPRPQPTPVEPVEPEAVEEAPAGAGGPVEEPVA